MRHAFSSPAPAARRIGVLGRAVREREYARRVLRGLGIAPWVFTSVEELAALGDDVARLNLLFLGDPPMLHREGGVPEPEVLSSLGNKVVLLTDAAPEPPPTRHLRGRPPIAAASFDDFHRIVWHALKARGLACAPQTPLAWGAYSFDPVDRRATFPGQVQRLDPVTFDLALEFFFNPGQVLKIPRLRKMMNPVRGATRFWGNEIIGTLTDVADALQLHGAHGWQLTHCEPEAFRLDRVPMGNGPGG
ncbi:hypothetical protein GFK26_11295 [Variovorax paradoxus]|uniref:Uncharacterized protein n=1 Tax=Variovorax paradoxus TaxID=34073 RepID=A0A5Q0M1J3_VARPD|nr:hypothetical protein [Variovorax paradoxus]QFZ83306.1 hypothetical protein GFK26_11295 [Variovorax paradoxus]